ncbi:MAG: hypothetical protein RJA49_2822 [Actinomycetota bacterium]
MRTRSLLVAAVATASLLAACGSDNSSSSATTGPANTVDGGGSGSGSGDTSAPGSTTVNTAPGAGSEFCKLNNDLATAASPFNSASSTAADFEKFFNEVVKPGVVKLQAAAPAEVKDDMDTLAEGYNALADRFAALGYDPTKASTDTVLSQLGNQQKYNDASKAVNDYCGV